MENEPDTELAKGLTSKEAATVEAESQPPPAKQRRRLPQGPDKCKLQATTAVIPSTTICLYQTGVPKKCISERASAAGQSIYKCMHPSCPYSTAQLAQCCTHIHRKHLGVCIKCQLCNHHSFQSVDIQKHLRDVHMNEEAKWFEPVPELEGDIVEINQATLKANIALVKEERLMMTRMRGMMIWNNLELPICASHYMFLPLNVFYIYVSPDHGTDCL